MSFFITGAELDVAYASGQVKFRPGQRARDESGRWFIFITYNQGTGSVTGEEGDFVALMDGADAYGPYEASADLDDANVLANSPAGQLQAELDNAEGGWAQYKGENRKAAVTDGNVAQNDLLKLDTGDGTIIRHTAGVAATIGTAKLDDAATALAIGSMDIRIDI